MNCNASDLLLPRFEGLDARFDAHDVRNAWLERATNTPCHFYLHIPFCRRRGSDCRAYPTSPSKETNIDDYLALIYRESGFFAPAFARRPFHTLYIGGGTPSLLTSEQLLRLMSNLFDTHEFHADGQRTVECHPLDVNHEKLKVLRRFGVNRISMGLNSPHPARPKSDILRDENIPAVTRAVRLIQEFGGFDLNLDLHLGRRTDDAASFIRSFETTLSFNPTEMTLYSNSPKENQRETFYEGSPRGLRAYLLDSFNKAPKLLGSANLRGYRIAPPDPTRQDHTWRFDRRIASRRFVYNEFPHLAPLPASVFGLGPAARSRVSGTLAYMDDKQLPAHFDPGRPSYVGHRLTPRDEMIKYLVVQICARRAEPLPEDFQRVFGSRIEAAFPAEVEALKIDGLLKTEGESLKFQLNSAEKHFRCASRFVVAPALTLETASGRWRLNIERFREGRTYLAQTAELGLRLETDGNPWPRRADARARLLAAIFHSAAQGRSASDAHSVERDCAKLLSAVAARIGAVVRMDFRTFPLHRSATARQCDARTGATASSTATKAAPMLTRPPRRERFSPK